MTNDAQGPSKPKSRSKRRLYTTANAPDVNVTDVVVLSDSVADAASAAALSDQMTARAPAPPELAAKSENPPPPPPPSGTVLRGHAITPTSSSPMLRRLKAQQTLRDHALLAAGAAIIPVPLLDMAAEAAIQTRMVKRLAEIYGVDFAEKRAKVLVAAALGGFSAGWAAGTLLRYASFATYFINLWPSAMLSSGITYGIGHLFIQHFEKGGGMHDLAPDTAASALKEKARSLRARLWTKPKPKSTQP